MFASDKSQNPTDVRSQCKAHTRFAPTLVSDIGWTLVLVSKTDEIELFPLTCTYALVTCVYTNKAAHEEKLEGLYLPTS